MTARALQTTREQVQAALSAEDRDGMDRWLAQDALAAHDLLDLLCRLDQAIGLDTAGRDPHPQLDALLEEVFPWLEG